MGLILQDLWIYTLYILRTGGKRKKNKNEKEKWDEENTEFETSCVM